MKRLITAVAAFLLVLLVGYFAYVQGLARGRAHGRAAANLEAESGKAGDSQHRVFALGRIEPRDGIINVNAIPGETLASLDIDDKPVESGALLGKLDGSSLAEANLKLAKGNLERLSKLPPELASRQRLEQHQLLVQQAQVQYDRTLIKAPASGTVLRTFVEPGESIGHQPVLQIANLKHMVVVAEVHEADVKRIQLDQPAAIVSRAFHAPYDKDNLKGVVKKIGQMIASPALQSLNPLASADRHVVEVRIELDEESSREAAKLINLEVDVWIETGKE